MTNLSSKHLSLVISQNLMKIVGYWNAETQLGRYTYNVLMSYTLAMTVGAIFIVVQDYCYVWGDFYAMTYAACSAMPVVVVLTKLTTFLLYRDEMMDLIAYTKENFWNAHYDAFGERVMSSNDKKAIVLICSFTFFVTGTIVCYAITPLFENVGKNRSEWILPFTMWNLPLPVNESPYYEIIFVLQAGVLLQAGLCFCCFDNFLGILNIHTAGQFKILQHEIRTICDQEDNKIERNYKPLKRRIIQPTKVYEKLKTCVRKHHMLISYVERLESMFSYMILCQLVVSGIMLCVAGFQAFQAQNSFIRRLIFIDHSFGSFFQIFVITLTANEMILESRNVGDAAYQANWYISHEPAYHDLKRGLIMIMVRSSRPCCITAGRFFPVSLETFVTVMSTAASYFTLLRSIEEES